MLFPTLLALLPLALASSDPPSSEPSADPTPAGAIWAPKWTSSDLASSPYAQHCAGRATLKAQIYTLGEMYPALKEWAPQLKVFYNKQLYPGSWAGKDVHGDGRELLKVGLEDVPFKVREWLKSNPDQRHFNVQDDIVFFAPGAIYPILPLFVDAPEESGDCDGVYEDLENYSAELKENAVLGKLTYKKLGKNELEIELEAFQVKGKSAKDEL